MRTASTLTVIPATSLPSARRGLGRVQGAAPVEELADAPKYEGGAAASARNAAVMAAGTTVSRLSGFARVLAVGWVLGQGSLSDAYNQANTVPNTVYELLLGGVLSATLLPVLMQSLAGRSTTDDDAVPAVATFLTVALVLATVVFWLAAPVLIDFYFLLRAPGAGGPAEKALATTWLRLFTPQLLFIGLTTVTTALLNARRRFAAVAFSPTVANLVTIVALVVADHMVRHASISAYKQGSAVVAVVGIGTTAGYLAQLLVQLPALWRARVPLRTRWYPRHPALRAIGRLSGWTVGAVVTNQISFTLVTILALKSAGSYSAFSYAYAFMLLPHAVLAVSIAYAVAPDLAELWSGADRDRFANRFAQAMRFTAMLVVPAGVGCALIARPLVLLALAHGNLGAASAGLTGWLLVIFACGLPGFSMYLLVMRAFQSKQDTRSMFWLYVVENGLTVVAALALYPTFGVRGLTAAWIGAYSLVLPFAWWRLRQSARFGVPANWWLRVGASAAFMGGVVATCVHLVPQPVSVGFSAVRLALVIVVGAAAFVLAAHALGVKELSAVRHLARRAAG